MKRLFIILISILTILSCTLYSSPPLGASNFPLTESFTKRFEKEIEEISVGNTWIAVLSNNSNILYRPYTLTALDINTLNILWSLEIHIENSLTEFQMANNVLIISSAEKITIIDQYGNQRELKFNVKKTGSITKILESCSDYLYIVAGPKWIFQVYDISQDKTLWSLEVGRTVGRVFCDSTEEIVYVTSDDFVRAYHNISGDLLWEKSNVYGQRVFYESGILYIPVQDNVEDAFTLVAITGASHRILWEKVIPYPPEVKASSSIVIDNLLIYRGYGMIAVDRFNGELAWIIPSAGEEFYGTPIKFNEIIYIKGRATGSVYAISANDGNILGTLRLEDLGWNTSTGDIFALEDGILFNTSHKVLIYK